MNLRTHTEIAVHAHEQHPEEACGLLVSRAGKEVYVPCTNADTEPTKGFKIAGEDYLAAKRVGTIVAVCHSHPNGAAEPSPADLSACEESKLPWYIFSCPSGDLKRYEPSGYKAPLLEREYAYGVHDCYTLVRDYYRETLGIALPYFETEEGWWGRGEDLFMQHFAEVGFRKVDELQKHDVIVMQFRSTVPDHVGVYIGDDVLLHHPEGRLSGRTVYGGYWAKHERCFLRHKDAK